MQPASPVIDLFEFEGLGLIVRWPSGVHYTNQVSGYACEHPSVEGVFVPLFDDTGRPALHALHQHFRGGWHALAECDGDVLDGILRRAGLGFITTDRAKLAESFEAWVCVTVHEDSQSRFVPRVRGFQSRAAVLTWQNSD